MRKIKVIQIGGNTQKNGITTFLLSLYRLMREDFSFIFINTAFRESDSEVRKTIEEYGGKIYHLPYAKNTSDIEDEFKKIVATEQPDVIHCHYFFSNGDYMRIGFEMDIPVRITHCLNDKSGYLNEEEQQLLIRSRGLTHKYATLKLAVSQNAGRFCYGDDKFEICHATTEAKRYFYIADKISLMKKFNLDTRFKYSLFVGRFAFQKNIEFLIDVIKQLPERRLILVGHGKEKESFINHVETAGIAHQFIFKSDENLNELYNIADSVLLPSRYEGLGLVLVEAQSAGTLCLASDRISHDADLGMTEYLPLDVKTWVNRLNGFERIKPVAVDTSEFDAEVIVGRLKDKYTPGDAYITLAKEYMLGGLERYADRKKVVLNLRKAHELGNPRGSFYYALQFFEGSGVDKDIKFAEAIVNAVLLDLERKAAEKQAEFIVILADMYSFGLGKPQSYEQAMKYYLMAADLGNLEAMCDLGYMYLVGQGTEKDLEKSFYWYLKSAELGYLHSMRDVGQAYYFGIGMEVDYKEAVNWFKKASELNYSHATCDLALCYLEGHGVKKNLTKAVETYLLALKQDEPRTIRDLIARLIDIEKLLSNGKIKFIKRDKIDAVDRNNFVNGTIVINAHIKSIEPSIFYDYTNIIKFFVEKENPYFKAYGGVLYSKDGETLIRFPLGSPITEFVVPNHVRHISERAFQNCRNLQSVKLHDCIESIGGSAFDDCKSMTQIELPQSLKRIGAWGFHACDKIEGFFIPAGLTEIGLYAFGSCESLKRIVVSPDNPNYTSKDGNLYTKDLSVLLQYAIGKTEKLFVLPKETKTIAFRAFSDAFHLEYIDVCSAVKIEEKAFYWCSNLKEVLLDRTCIIDGKKVFDETAEGFSVIHRKHGRIILLADIHGHLRLDFTREKLSKLKLQAEDVVVILGDAGIVWQEPMRVDIKEFYSSLPCALLFLDGNHENFDLLNRMKTVTRYGGLVHEVLPNVFHLLRGQAYLVNGKKCFVFGGAYSIKRENNSSPVHTWESELPNVDEYRLGLKTAAENENRFDLIFTHQAPRSLLDAIDYVYANAETKLLDYLEKLKQEVSFDLWYFGHIHRDLQEWKLISLYENCEVIE
jgi:TPR repeat protein/predicted phosphodiesterase